MNTSYDVLINGIYVTICYPYICFNEYNLYLPFIIHLYIIFNFGNYKDMTPYASPICNWVAKNIVLYIDPFKT